ncbi:MAG: translation initiation factor IF-2, partial [Selenomonas sp.]|nr:translation initiation factor IF-2 [Selenomonas sp.]
MGCEFYAAPVMAQASEAWVYDSLMLLVQEGYMEMPEKPLSSYSRKELGQMISQALVEFEKNRTGSRADEYARISRLLVVDEVQLKLAKEQERVAEDQLERARSRAAKDTEMYVRRSMQGQNRLEVMEPLKQKSDTSLKKLEMVSRDYAQAKSRVEQRTKMLEYVCQRQRNLLSGLSGNGESNDTTAMPKNVMMSADGMAVQGTTDSVIPASLLDTVGKLRAEFMTELDSNGSLDNMNARQQLESNLPVEDVPDQRLKVDAEVRFDTGHSTGDNGNGTRSRIRARVYPDYNIDNNWHAIGMVEWEKTLNGNAYNDDGKLKLDRYYLSGNIGAVHTDIGAFGSLMAEGNIYDSKFIG